MCVWPSFDRVISMYITDRDLGAHWAQSLCALLLLQSNFFFFVDISTGGGNAQFRELRHGILPEHHSPAILIMLHQITRYTGSWQCCRSHSAHFSHLGPQVNVVVLRRSIGYPTWRLVRHLVSKASSLRMEYKHAIYSG